MSEELRMAYLRALFAACPAGIPAREIAALAGDSPAAGEAVVLALWREGKAARVPNPRSRGFLWRSPMHGDAAAGFLFEEEGEPRQVKITVEMQDWSRQ